MGSGGLQTQETREGWAGEIPLTELKQIFQVVTSLSLKNAKYPGHVFDKY